MKAIYKRELRAYLNSPIGFVFLGTFTFLWSMLFYFNNIVGMSSNFNAIFGMMSLIIMLLIPILTMRLLSEDKANKTEQLLFTAPITTWEIVLGKFFAAAALMLLAIIFTLPHLIILVMHGDPAVLQILAAYLGFYLLSLSYMAIGEYISSFTESQVVSAFITFGIFLGLMLIEFFGAQFITNDALRMVYDWISVSQRFTDFQLGVLNIVPIVYYLSLIFIFLFLTARRLEKRRWN